MELTDKEIVEEIIDETPNWAFVLRRKAEEAWDVDKVRKNPQSLFCGEDLSGSMTREEIETATSKLQNLLSDILEIK